MSNTTSGGGSGIGLGGALTVLFVGLKLTGHINWTWWWVLSPLWISVALFLVFVTIAAAVVAWRVTR